MKYFKEPLELSNIYSSGNKKVKIKENNSKQTFDCQEEYVD